MKHFQSTSIFCLTQQRFIELTRYQEILRSSLVLTVSLGTFASVRAIHRLSLLPVDFMRKLSVWEKNIGALFSVPVWCRFRSLIQQLMDIFAMICFYFLITFQINREPKIQKDIHPCKNECKVRYQTLNLLIIYCQHRAM